MKTETLNVSVPAELAEFARQDMGFGAYGSLNEYLRDLLRKRRAERIAQDVQFVRQAVEQAPPDDPGQPFFDRVAALQKEIRHGRKRGK